MLTEHGLGPALQSAADRCAVPVTVALSALGRHPPDIEAAVYFCCVEAMQNVAKHAASSSIVLSGGCEDSTLWFAVTDDGPGFDPLGESSGRGIVNIRDRLGSVGGGLDVSSSPGAGATVRGHVPLVDR